MLRFLKIREAIMKIIRNPSLGSFWLSWAAVFLATLPCFAQTGKIYEAFWMDQIDSETIKDGYCRSASLNWNETVLNGTGNNRIQVRTEVYYMRPCDTSWTLLANVAAHYITNLANNYQKVGVANLKHGTYDFMLKLYRVSPAVLDDTRSSTNDPVLRLAPFETATDDVDNRGAAMVRDAYWINPVDCDGDGYKESATLWWDVDVVSSTSPLLAYESIYYKRISTNQWRLYATTASHNITGATAADARTLLIAGLPLDLYDWRIEAYGSGDLHNIRCPLQDADLANYGLETPLAGVQDASWTNEIDRDHDGHRRSANLTWTVAILPTCGGSLVVSNRIYYSRGGVSNFLVSLPAHSVTNNQRESVPVTNLSSNLYNWFIEIYRQGVATPDYIRNPTNDADLASYRLETPDEDRTVEIVANSAYWLNDTDIDNDGYHRSAELWWWAHIDESTTVQRQVFEKVEYRAESDGIWRHWTNTMVHPVGYNASRMTAGLISGLAHDLYDWRISIFRVETNVADQVFGPANDPPDLDNYPLETDAQDPYLLRIQPAFLDFGTGRVGQTYWRYPIASNAGNGTLTGAASLTNTSTGHFRVTGSTVYSLTTNSRTFQLTVEYHPQSSGAHTNALQFTAPGGIVSNLVVRGVATNPAALAVSPASLDFGSIRYGTTASRSFTLRNTGDGVISGTATVDPPFLIVPPANYTVGNGQTGTVLVQFQPADVGAYSKTVNFSGAAGAASTVTGTATNSARLAILPATNLFDFGPVPVGSNAEISIVVSNAGSDILGGGMWAVANPPFSVTEGPSYNLAPGATQAAQLRFSPKTAGQFNGSLIYTPAWSSQAAFALRGSGGYPPVVTQPPTNCAGFVTDTLRLSVTVTGTPPFAYQWQLAGTNLTGGGRFTGVNEPQLVVTNLQCADAGVYCVQVTNLFGAITSAPALLTIPSTLRFDTTASGLGMTNGAPRLRLTGLSGQGTLIVYASTNQQLWLPIHTNDPTLGDVEVIDWAATNLPARFYRAIEMVVPLDDPLQFDDSSDAVAMNSRGFRLLLSGLTGRGPVVIYASTNCAVWQPIATNPPALGKLEFIDAAALSQPRRFYRATEKR